MLVFFSVFYILVAAAMIVLILMQRGAGADAGSGFGAGASATVFGARGSASFLTRATAVLAALFFLLSLGMGIYLKAFGAPHSNAGSDLGVMADLGNKPASAQNAIPAVPVGKSAATAAVPAAPAASAVKAGASSAPASTAPNK